jgi:hypothetical protein
MVKMEVFWMRYYYGSKMWTRSSTALNHAQYATAYCVSRHTQCRTWNVKLVIIASIVDAYTNGLILQERISALYANSRGVVTR